YFTSDKLSLGFKFTLVAVILISAIIVAYFKMKETNVTAFIPALFLMVVITALELSLVLRAAVVGFILLLLVRVLVVNAYQLLTLQKATYVDDEHKRKIEARREQYRNKREEQPKKQGNANKKKIWKRLLSLKV